MQAALVAHRVCDSRVIDDTFAAVARGIIGTMKETYIVNDFSFFVDKFELSIVSLHRKFGGLGGVVSRIFLVNLVGVIGLSLMCINS
jgi:hypothetical protein